MQDDYNLDLVCTAAFILGYVVTSEVCRKLSGGVDLRGLLIASDRQMIKHILGIHSKRVGKTEERDVIDRITD